MFKKKKKPCHSVNAGVSDHLASSILTPDPLYNGSEAITAYGAEARNENALYVYSGLACDRRV